MSKDEILKGWHTLVDMKGQFQSGVALSLYLRQHPDFRTLIVQLARVFFDTPLGSCDSCIMDAYVQLVRLSEDAAIAKASCLFRLKKGCLLYGDSVKVISNYNITNEIAIEHLRNHRDDLKWFDLLPDDIDVLLSDTPAKTTATTKTTAKTKKSRKSKKNA